MDDYLKDLVNPSAAVEKILLDSDSDEELDEDLVDDETQTPLPMSGIDTVDGSNSKKRKYCLNKVEPHTAQEKLAKIKDKLYSLFESYAERFPQNNASSGSYSFQMGDPSNRGDDPLALDIPEDLRNISFEIDALHRKSSLDLYLDESVLDINSKVDVLQYWRSQNHRFPDLACMACDVLSIPITIVASESAFSIDAHVLNKYRNSLLHKNVQALICTRNWIHGFHALDGEEVVKDEDEDENDKD